MKASPRLAKFSWALYDFANTIFSANIVSIYFMLWITSDRNCPELHYSLAFSGSVLLAAVCMPFVGEISDRLKRRIPFLIVFTLGCVLFTALLGTVKGIFSALLLFALANFCYQLGCVVYNALLPQVSTRQTLGRTSGLGVSLGYVGVIIGLLLVKPFYDLSGRQATFLPTAGLFLAFALPAFIFIKDPPHPHIPRVELQIKPTFQRLLKNLRQIKKDPSLRKFLISAFLCLNAVNTIIIYMAKYAEKVMNFTTSETIYFMIISNIFAIAGSYVFGHITDVWGSKRTLGLVIKLWCLVIFLAAISVSRWMFWIVGPLAGIFLGATWVSARTMLVELSAQEDIGQMFGIFGLAGRFSAILGPVVWGIIVNILFVQFAVFKYRLAVISIFLFMLGAYFIFRGVRDPRKN